MCAAPPKHAVVCTDEVQLFLGPRDRDVCQPALLLHFIIGTGNGFHSGKDAVLHTRDENDRELKSLGAVNRHEYYGVSGLIVFVHIGDQRDLLQIPGKRSILIVFLVFRRP